MFSSIKKGLTKVSLAAALLIGLGSPVQAGLLDTYLVPNEINFFEDNSREAYFDANNSGFFDPGDVLVGYLRLEQRTAPAPSVDVGNTLYAIFSQQVASVNAFGVVTFAPTTVAGLQLSDIVAGAEANAIVALYSGDVGLDLTLNSPGDVTGVGGVTLLDYLRAITAGDLELTAGIAGGDDQFKAISGAFPLSTATIGGLETTDGVAQFEALLSILTNNTSFTFGDDVCTALGFFGGLGGIPAGSCSQLQILSGNVAGASNAANFLEWTNGSELGAFTQCPPVDGNPNGSCGFVDNADINVHPLAVPEPASMILFGLGLTALGIYGRRRMNRQQKSE